MTDDKKIQEQYDKNSLLLRITERKLSEQISSIDSFNIRTGLILATIGVVFTGFTQLVTSDLWITFTPNIFFVLELISILLSGLFAFVALSIGAHNQHWRNDPDPEKLYRLSKEKNISELEEDVIKTMIVAYKENIKIYKTKFNFIKKSVYCMYTCGTLIFIHLLTFFIQ